VWLAELSLFALSVGAVSYCSEKHEWGLFLVFVMLCVVLFGLLKYFEAEPSIRRLRDMEKREFNYTYRFAAWGMSNIFNMQDNKEMQQRNLVNLEIIERGNVFSLLAESGASYLDPAIRRHWDALKTKLEHGVPLRLLLVNPFSPAKQVRNKRNNVRSIIDPKLRLDLIGSVLRQYESVEVRFTDEVYSSLFITDKEMIYDPYHLGKAADRIENYFLAIHIQRVDENERRDFYQLLKDHFEFLWASGLRLPQFVARYEKELEPELSALLSI
jgi:hypothetical protein